MVVIYARWFRRRNLLRWLRKRGNFGDELNPLIIAGLSGQDVAWVPRTGSTTDGSPVYLVIGSILHWADTDTVVWGAGFMSADAVLRGRPRAVHAVRGPLSRKRLLELGVDCPPVHGDPALLYPLLYRPAVEKRHPIGVIPHYSDMGSDLVKKMQGILEGDLKRKIRVIDPGRAVNDVVSAILSCERIASSSLHGIIVSHAYGIPAAHISFGSPSMAGMSFKYRDYFASVEIEYSGLTVPRCDDGPRFLADLEALPFAAAIRTDHRALLEACPFLSEEHRKRLDAEARLLCRPLAHAQPVAS